MGCSTDASFELSKFLELTTLLKEFANFRAKLYESSHDLSTW